MKLFLVLLLALVSCVAALDAQGSSAPITGQTPHETGSATGEPPVFSTPTGKRRGELATEGTSTMEAMTTEGIHTSSTRATVLISTKRPSVNQEKRADVEMDNYHGVFDYDEGSLRKWGLVAAAILFILGILILTCGKHGKLLRCRGKKRTRNYDVTQA